MLILGEHVANINKKRQLSQTRFAAATAGTIQKE